MKIFMLTQDLNIQIVQNWVTLLKTSIEFKIIFANKILLIKYEQKKSLLISLIQQSTSKMKENEMQNQETEQEYDIYFKGSKNQLFAMLYPLTGPNSQIFDHLEIDTLKYHGHEKQLQFSYKTKDFNNIDKQQFNVFYTSTALQTHSNYFYSTFHPDKNAVVWQNITRMVELRPTPPLPNVPIVKPPSNSPHQQELMQGQQIRSQDQIKQLTIVNVNDETNWMVKDIESVPDTERSKLGKNWDISRDQYIVRLCQ